MPSHVSFVILEARDLPVFDADIEVDWNERLREIKGQVLASDGIIVCSPEYNGSHSGHVKNTIDWLSRDSNPFKDKPSTAITVSGGVSGGTGAGFHLRHILLHLGSPYMPKPTLSVPKVAGSFDEDDKLTDETVQRHIEAFVPAFVEWVEKFRQ